MNKLDEAVQIVKDELEAARKQYLLIQQLGVENKIEQDKIVEQNINIKDRIRELSTSQAKADSKTKDLDEREKQIVIKEKSLIISNRLLDEKLLDFRKKTIELAEEQKKLKKDLQEFQERKKLVDQQALINQKMEETELLKKNKLKIKEEQLDKELSRLREMQI